tara:strand:+ start:137 stop:349 length:213 start_codon:yes stop_codon:yes gene_type:complete
MIGGLPLYPVDPPKKAIWNVSLLEFVNSLPLNPMDYDHYKNLYQKTYQKVLALFPAFLHLYWMEIRDQIV